jgi:hypothetical protein
MRMKYKSPITYHSKDNAKVKVLKKWVKVTNYGTVTIAKVKARNHLYMNYESTSTNQQRQSKILEIYLQIIKKK